MLFSVIRPICDSRICRFSTRRKINPVPKHRLWRHLSEHGTELGRPQGLDQLRRLGEAGFFRRLGPYLNRAIGLERVAFRVVTGRLESRHQVFIRRVFRRVGAKGHQRSLAGRAGD